MALTNIRDLKILADTLPENKQAELFISQNVEPFIRSLLRVKEDAAIATLSDQRRIMLAATMADICLEYCTLLYSAIEPDEIFAKANVDLFERVRDIIRRLPVRAYFPRLGGASMQKYSKAVVSMTPEEYDATQKRKRRAKKS